MENANKPNVAVANWNLNSRALTSPQPSATANGPSAASRKEYANSLLFPFPGPSPFPFPFLSPFPDATSWNVNSRELGFRQFAIAPSTASQKENQANVAATDQWRQKNKQNENAKPAVTATSWNVDSRELSFLQLAIAPGTASQEENYASVAATDRRQQKNKEK